MHGARCVDSTSALRGASDVTQPCPTAAGRVSRFSPDLRLLILAVLCAAAISWRSGTRGTAEASRLAESANHPGRIEGVAFSADGRLAASASRECTVRVWDVATRRPRGHAIRGLSGFSCVAFSPDGKTLACAGLDGKLVLWDLATGRERSRFAASSAGAVRVVAFSPDGELLATGGDDRAVRVWDASSGAEGHVMRGHEDKVNGLAFAPDGRSLSSAGPDGRVISWDLATGQILGGFDGGCGPVWSLALAPDGHSLALGGRDGIAIRDLEAGRTRMHRCQQGPITDVCFLRSGAALAASDSRGRFSIWDVTGSDLRVRKTIDLREDGVVAMAASPDGSTLLTGSNHSTLVFRDLARLDP